MDATELAMQINLMEYFEKTCKRWPSKTAVVDSNGAWDFETLDRRARAIASEIARATSSANTPIAVFLPKSREAVAAILAVLSSGNCYAPLDTKAPNLRTMTIVNHLNPSLILTSGELSQILTASGIDASSLLILDGIIDCQENIVERWHQSIDSDPAYIIHTSGSTGRPKGVVISHRGVIDYIDWARDCYAIDENCVIGNQAPMVFDNSTLDLYLCLACGATLHMIPEELFLFPRRLLEYLEQNSINFIFWVPSIMVNVANMGALDLCCNLSIDKILFAGEVMPARQLNLWRKRFPDALFSNLYGPTEITVDCTYYIVDRDLTDEEPVPIGKACRNTAVLILNDLNQKCRPTEKGELCVRGVSLALGYWNDQEKTLEAFVQNPLNPYYPETIYRTGDVVYENEKGEIIYVGRKDFQIKHMGYRIELGDIEHFVLLVQGIQKACVLYHNKKKEIIVVYEAGADIDSGVIRKELGRYLPKYMLPTIFRRLSELPQMANGKIDRQLLEQEVHYG